jgi:hypothetical protein
MRGLGCGCLATAAILGVLLTIAGLMDTFAKSRPDIGVPIIAVGVVLLAIVWYVFYSSDKKWKR